MADWWARLMEIDLRFAYYVVWGLGSTVVWGVPMVREYRAWRNRDDSRSRRELVSSVALFLTSLLASTAVLAVLFGETGVGLRGFLTALALGAFFAAGIVKATDNGHSTIRKGES